MQLNNVEFQKKEFIFCFLILKQIKIKLQSIAFSFRNTWSYADLQIRQLSSFHPNEGS